jgi:hypothetical protein
MGEDINVHDQWAVESLGPIQDRTREHLGTSDRAIIACRKLLFRAIDDVAAGRPPLLTADAGTLTGPPSIDAIGPVEGWEAFWQAQDQARRAGVPWCGVSLAAV